MLRPLLALLAAFLLAPTASAAPTTDELVARLRTVDDRQRNQGDFQAQVYLEQKEKGKSDLVYEAEVYRRDASDKLVIFFTRPQAEAGKGYLRIDANLFVYDPTVGRWERRTERERIGGTSSNRADFDESRLADEYAPAWVGDETLGRFPVERLRLSARPGVDVAWPVVELWLDQASGNVLKRQDFALSGRLLRTTYYPQWIKVFSPSKKGDVYYPREIRIFDEIEKGTTTTIVFQQVKLDPLGDSLFTKAWLEARSR